MPYISLPFSSAFSPLSPLTSHFPFLISSLSHLRIYPSLSLTFIMLVTGRIMVFAPPSSPLSFIFLFISSTLCNLLFPLCILPYTILIRIANVRVKQAWRILHSPLCPVSAVKPRIRDLDIVLSHTEATLNYPATITFFLLILRFISYAYLTVYDFGMGISSMRSRDAYSTVYYLVIQPGALLLLLVISLGTLTRQIYQLRRVVCRMYISRQLGVADCLSKNRSTQRKRKDEQGNKDDNDDEEEEDEDTSATKIKHKVKKGKWSLSSGASTLKPLLRDADELVSFRFMGWEPTHMTALHLVLSGLAIIATLLKEKARNVI